MGLGGGGGGSGGGGGGSGGGRGGAVQRRGSGCGQRQQQQRRSETPTPQQLREWFSQRGASGGSVRCPYVIRTGDQAGQTCGKVHTQHRCFSRHDDAWRSEFGDEAERPRRAELLRSGVDIFALDYDDILATMYALSVSAQGDCYLYVPLDPGIEAATLGASESALLGIAPADALHTFTLDSSASRCFFRDSTTLNPLPAPIPVSLAYPTGGPVLAHSSTVIPFPANSSDSLSCLHLPSFSTNLVAAYAQVSASRPVAAPCPCRLLSHQTLLWHHRLGHPSLPRLRGMHSRLLLNLWPRVSLLETSPTLRWMGKVGDALVFWVLGSRAFVRNTYVDKLSSRTIPCVFLGFPPDAPGRQFYHPTSHRVLPSQVVTFDESVPFCRLIPYRTAPLPPPPLFLARGPPPVDPLPPQGPAPSGVSQVDPLPGTVPDEVAVDSSAARGVASGGATCGGAEPASAEPGGAEPEGAEPGGAEPEGAEPRGAKSEGAESGGAEPGGTKPGVTEHEGAGPGGAESGDAEPRGTASGDAKARGFAAGGTGAGGAGVTSGAGGTGGLGAVGPGGGRTRGTVAAGAGVVGGNGARDLGAGNTSSGGAGAGGPGAGGTGVGGSGARGAGGGGPGAGGTGAGDPGAGDTGTGGAGAGGAGAGRAGTGIGDPRAAGAGARGAGASGTGAGGTVRRRPFFPDSPLPAPSPYAEQTDSPSEHCEPASRPASPVCVVRIGHHVPRPRTPPVPGTHVMALRPSFVPLPVPLPSPPVSSLPGVPDPKSDLARATIPTVPRLLSSIITDPSFESTVASALVAELVDFAAACRLDYATSLVAESESDCPPSIGGECALGMDVLEDGQQDFECLAAAVPHLVAMLLARKGDLDTLDIPNSRSYAKAITGPYSS
ncbi:unnamed protein product [Closterium sp. NIES-54]